MIESVIYMIDVKIKFDEEKEIMIKGMFLEGEQYKTYKNASIDNRVFLYFDKFGKISYKTQKKIKVYERKCNNIRETENDKIHLFINPYVFEWEIIYYQWTRNENYRDSEFEYHSMAEYILTNIYISDELCDVMRKVMDKSLLLGVEDEYPGLLDKRISEIMNNCINVRYVEKQRIIGML